MKWQTRYTNTPSQAGLLYLIVLLVTQDLNLSGSPLKWSWEKHPPSSKFQTTKAVHLSVCQCFDAPMRTTCNLLTEKPQNSKLNQ